MVAEGVGDGEDGGDAVHDFVGEDAAHFGPAFDGGCFELGGDVVDGDYEAALAGAGGEEGGADCEVAYCGAESGTELGEDVGEVGPVVA